MTIAPWITQQFPQLTNLVLLAEGGQKWVLAGTHATEGEVVLKIIKPSTDGGERIHREILAVQQVGSARVPRMREASTVATPIGQLVWVREDRIPGESVRDRLKRGPMSIVESARLGLHVLEALADAERVRIVHRDVKPDNIIFATDGAFWLLDFGVARHLNLDSLTATALPGGVGTLGYAPPEQFRNKKRDIDGRADLFALGVTIVECLTGTNPFRHGARDAAEVVRRIERGQLAVPKISGDPQGAFGDVLSSMTQPRADCRPATAAEALGWFKDATAWALQ